MFFNEDHLRVTKVKTTDGITPVFNEYTGKPETKIVYFPDTPQANQLLKELNGRLPTHLKMKVEKVRGYIPQALSPAPAPDVSALEKEIAELKALNQKLLNSQEVNKAEAKESKKEVKEKVQA